MPTRSSRRSRQRSPSPVQHVEKSPKLTQQMMPKTQYNEIEDINKNISEQNDEKDDQAEEDKDSDNETSQQVVFENVVTVTLTLTCRNTHFSDGHIETVRDSSIFYSEGINPENIDFQRLVMGVLNEIPEHLRQSNTRFTSAEER